MYKSSLSRELHLLSSQRFVDDRGCFEELFNKERFEQETGVKAEFVQDNLSRSNMGVVRGLHYQVGPKAQGKLVRVLAGSVFDVAVDVRRASETFGDWFGLEMSAEKGNQMWIPPGFAHGFLALSEGAEVLYKTTEFYSPEDERAIRWDDPTIGIKWPKDRVGDVKISDRDATAPNFPDAEVFE